MADSASPNSPRLLKGALVVFAAEVPVPTGVILFQYNPETVTRRLESTAKDSATAPKAGDAKAALGGPPTETIALTVELSAADALEGDEPIATVLGLHPQLAQLEALMYPGAAIELLNQGLALAGIAAVAPAKQPLVLLAWGVPRIIPVRVTSVAITEQHFDPLLNPVEAKVELGLRVLTAEDLTTQNAVFRALPLVRSIAREALAAEASVTGVADVVSSISL
jgi:hypothetical protein